MTTFRPATVDDIPQLVVFVNQAYRGDTARQGWTHEADLLAGQRVDEEMIQTIIETTDNVILLMHVHQEQQQQQSINFLASVHLRREQEICHLGMFAVQPTSQNKGLGRTMLNYVTRNFLPQQWPECTCVEMTVIKQREELIAWYVRRGFSLVPGEMEAFPYGDVRFGEPKRPDLEFLKLRCNL